MKREGSKDQLVRGKKKDKKKTAHSPRKDDDINITFNNSYHI